MSTEGITVCDELATDPNFIALEAALESREFDILEPGTWIAYNDGQLVGQEMDREKLFQELSEQGIEGFLCHQVGVPLRIVHLPTRFRVLRSGMPTNEDYVI